MKTNKVIKEIEYMNLQVETQDDYLCIWSGREQIASISLKIKFEINTSYWAFKNLLAEDEREKVYVLLTKLAETDPDDREEEKRYYLKHKWLIDGERRYLNLYVYKNEYEINSKANFAEFKTQFTQAEINEIKERLNTNLEDFELIEVVE